MNATPAEPDTRAESLRCPFSLTQPPFSPRQVALCFLVRHAAHHDAIWRAWLMSAAGLLPAAAVHAACCGGPSQQKTRRALLQEVSIAHRVALQMPPHGSRRCGILARACAQIVVSGVEGLWSGSG